MVPRSRQTGCRLAVLVVGALSMGADRPAAAREPLVFTQWTTFRSQADGLPNDRIRSLRTDGSGLWVGTMGGVASYADGQWKTWKEEHGAPRTPVRAIDVAPDTGDVWLGTWGEGLYRFSSGRFDRFDQINSGLPGNLIFSLMWFDGAVWAATNGGLSMYHPLREEWRVFHARQGDGAVPVVTSLGGDGRNLFAMTRQSEVLEWTSELGTWDALTVVQPGNAPPLSEPATLSTRPLGMTSGTSCVWWVGRDTLLRRDGAGLWSRHARATAGRASEPPPTLYAANEGVLAIGGARGLSVLYVGDEDTWIDYLGAAERATGCAAVNRPGANPMSVPLSSSPPMGPIRCVAFAGDSVWVGTDGGLFRGASPVPWSTLKTTTAPCDSTNDPVHSPQTSGEPLKRTLRNPSVRHDAKEPGPATIGIGLIGPRNRTIALPGEPAAPGRPTDRPELAAVQTAVERANAGAGQNASAFEVIIRTIGYANYGWGTKEDDFATLAADRHVAGLLAYFDPRDETTLAVIEATEIPVVNVHSGNGPERDGAKDTKWLFTCHGGEPRRHRMLIDDLLDHRGMRRVALVSLSDAAGRRHSAWWRDHLAARGQSLAADLVLRRDPTAVQDTVAALRKASPDVILTSCDAETSANLLRTIRAGALDALVVGGPELRETGIAESLAADAEPLLVVLEPRKPDAQDSLGGFRTEDAARKPTRPADAATTAHARRSSEAAEHLIAAVSAAGTNRAAVQGELQAISLSATGEAHYERSHRPTHLRVASFVNGRWVEATLPPGE